MNKPADDTRDDELLADLRRMWQHADPMPSDLPDRVLFALELEQLDVDFELLQLVSSAREEDAGVRSTTTDVSTITFSGPTVTVMIRVRETRPDRRQIDGWLAPTTPTRVTVHHPGGRSEVEVDDRGRFVLDDVPSGLTRLVLAYTDDPRAKPFATPPVEL
jgi:hypothetical protein